MSDIPLNKLYAKLCQELGDLHTKKSIIEQKIAQKQQDIRSLESLVADVIKNIDAEHMKGNNGQ